MCPKHNWEKCKKINKKIDNALFLTQLIYLFLNTLDNASFGKNMTFHSSPTL